MDPLGLLRKKAADTDGGFVTEAMEVLMHAIMEANGIGRYYGKWTAERLIQRNGYVTRACDTRLGTLDFHSRYRMAIPKLYEVPIRKVTIIAVTTQLLDSTTRGCLAGRVDLNLLKSMDKWDRFSEKVNGLVISEQGTVNATRRTVTASVASYNEPNC